MGSKIPRSCKSDDFFEVAKYPTAKLMIKSDDGKSLSADLTIKSKTNPIKISLPKKEGLHREIKV